MIAFDLEYHRPESLAEATEAFRALDRAGRRPLYYGGGTEILTRGRLGEIRPGALIDLKGIAELRQLAVRDGILWLGAALTLAEICEQTPWPLLRAACGRVADHTTRCQITLGGNLAGTIPYREAVLPLLVAEADAVVVGLEGTRTHRLRDLFSGSLRLRPGEFLAEVGVDVAETDRPHVCRKRTRIDWVDYPVVTLAVVDHDDAIRLAVSGLCAGGPFRDAGLERVVSDRGEPAERRAARAAAALPAPVLGDIHATAGYRRFVFARALADALAQLGR